MIKMSRRVFLMGGVAALPYLYLERLSVAVRRYRVPVWGLPSSLEGFTILHLSDLHDKEFGAGGQELLALIGHERFDLVALTGDLVVGDSPLLTPALELVAGIRKLAGGVPIFSVSGNHDWRLERAAELNGRLREAGARVLSNGSAVIERGADRLWVAGVDDPVTRRDRLELALSGTERQRPRLLLSHSPQTYPGAVREGVDLTLSGHTHGGQLRLPLVGAAFVPAMGFFPRYDYGPYRLGKSTLIVSGGLGESGIPIRFNIRPEFSLVTLVAHRGAEPARDAAG